MTYIKAESLNELRITSVGKTVSEGVASEKYAFKTKDNSVIEIGTERHSPPKPYLKMDKWDGEVFLKVRMPFATGDNPQIIGNKIRYSTADKPLAQNTLLEKLLSKFTARAQENNPRVDIDIYPKPADEQNEDGGVEFDTIFYEKPSINMIVFPIETANLDFFYQPALTQEEIDEGTERPENVVGSYAVYHSGNPINYVGGKEYKTGKAFHIYRPKVIDANGKEVWGELHIDKEKGILTITVPQEYLDNAAYPVTVDPTFGYTTAGASFYSVGTDDAAGSVFTAPSDVGTADSLTAYVRCPFCSTNGKGVIWLHSDGNVITNGVGSVFTFSEPVAWKTSTFSTPPSLTPSTDYVLGVVADASGSRINFDAGTTNQGHVDTDDNSYANPGNLDAIFPHNNNKYSVYVTYTVRPNTDFQGVDMQGINVN